MAFSANSTCMASQVKILLSLSFPSLPKPQNHPNNGFQFQHKNCINSSIRTNHKQLFVVSASTAKNVVSQDDVLLQQNGSLTSSSSTASVSRLTGWTEFAKNVSGEWDGFGADFSTQGKPIELPESVVPEAYREWEVKVFDWQTQCPTLAEPQDLVAKYKLINLLPTVGCEADAATQYSIDERHIGGPSNKVSAFAYQSSGCYVAVWPLEDFGMNRLLELEHCLVDPQNRESRVRLIQVICVEDYKLVLKHIKLFCEQWYGPFRNGEQLGGCAIRDSAFASTDALKSSEVSGVWQGLSSVAKFQNSQHSIIQELMDNSVRKSVREENNLILLPKHLWCSLKVGEDGNNCCEVGWLLNQGHAITSKCILSNNAELKEVSVACESADIAQ